MKKAPSNVISSYKRRQQMGPFILWGAVALLIFVGLAFLIAWLAKPNSPMMALFSSATPTATATSTSTSTPTLTLTPTETATPTITMSPTASEPFKYTVQENDNLTVIGEKFNLGTDGLELLLYLNPYDSANTTNPGINPATQGILVGQVINIPNPGMPLPSPTPLPADLRAGTELTYTIRPGDYLELIASKFNSTVEDIKKLNNIVEDNSIQAGQLIKVRANLVTPTAAPKPTITQGASPTPPSPYTPTPDGGVPPTASPTVTVTLTSTVKP